MYLRNIGGLQLEKANKEKKMSKHFEILVKVSMVDYELFSLFSSQL